MALNFPYPATAGQTYTDDNSAVWQFDGVKWDVITSTTKKLFSGAKASLTTYVSLLSTDVLIEFHQQDFDIDDYYNVSQAGRFTIPKNGFYRITATFFSGNNGNGSSYTIKLKKNGSTTVVSNTMAANQSAVYEEILQLSAGDYLEFYANETEGVGTLLANSFVEVVRLGLTPGVGIAAYDSFSGARTSLTIPVSCTTASTAISWVSTTYDTNADVLGNTYWTNSTPTRLTVKQTGYFEIKTMVYTGSAGTDNSYLINFKKNGTTTLTSSTVSPNETVSLNEIFVLNKDDYVEIYNSNSGGIGTILETSYLEITRLGV